ncbi:LSU ribosomal protein L23P [Orenia metallireducens]|jgi:large subunit ribosomal protein L23|uniref:Large ribosomal subunit protein uL23 n=2 Tax=Orenia metallireducens TaxID=1413210 RepID=A0A1C0ABT8_9FIRM|nr:50S ribosomal protein L23 [Orenia metallireducens]OCL27837.1 50S ribosomal protein L23 [Orenia metallireducens]PRX26207.1 LSU ribosomal protein L23P [Orenia metallireducens]SNY31871.1 LSU ribosomal protein L23P [Orenia metallireducens]
MKDPRDIIIAPHISERSMMDMEENWYTFKVAIKANKPEIKKAIEKIFDVNVEKVTTNRMPGKKRRMGYTQGKTSNWKKARVKLAEGDSIEIFEGV